MKLLCYLSFLLLLVSCNFSGDESAVKKAVTGDWLILYPDEAALSQQQLANYAPVQDSLVRLYGLRLLQLKNDGSFTEPDYYFNKPGSWELFQDKKLVIKSAQPGFGLYIASLQSYKENKLRLLTTIAANKDSLPIFWVLKKINSDHPAHELFTEKWNRWRQHPAGPEAEVALKERLKQILEWSALYFETVADEAIYFSRSRVVLPFNYYAHGVGLKSLENAPAFAAVFYNEANAIQAMQLLKTARLRIHGKFPQSKNYVKEYAQHFKDLAAAL